jgi:hypothetical protein
VNHDLARYIPELTLTSVPLFWLVVCYALSWASGWRDLADVYEDRGEFVGERFWMRSGALRLGQYNNCLNFGTNSDGLSIKVFAFFRPGHPPLFIPWSEITAEDEKAFFAHRTVLSFQRVPHIRLRIVASLAEDLLHAAGGAFQVKSL